MNVADTVEHLKSVAEREGIQYEEKALAFIAEKADGGMRDALSIFDQVVSYSQGNVTYEKTIEDLNELDADNYFRIVDLAVENRVTEIMLLLNDIVAKGFDPGHLINGLASHLRNVLMAKDTQTLPLLEVSQEQAAKYQDQALKCPTPFLYQGIKLLNRCDLNYRQSSNKRLLVEITLIQLAQATQPDDEDSAGRSPRRLKSLFRKLLKSQSIEAEQVAETVTEKHEEQRQQPTPQPSQEKPKMKLSGLGMTFGSLLQKPQTEKEDEEKIEVEGEESTFSQEQLELEWRAMCNRMPDNLRAMAYRLKNLEPHITNYPEVEITIGNQMLLDSVEKISKRIKATLAQSLNNNAIQLHFRLAQAEEIKELPTPEQLLNNMKQQYDWFNTLINDYDLVMV